MKYIKPSIEKFEVETSYPLNNGSVKTTKQCDCETYRWYGGCIGCEGNCGCCVWDPEEETIIPGC